MKSGKVGLRLIGVDGEGVPYEERRKLEWTKGSGRDQGNLFMIKWRCQGRPTKTGSPRIHVRED